MYTYIYECLQPERPPPVNAAPFPDLDLGPNSQPGALRPLRAVCYALLRGHAPSANGFGNTLLDVVAEVATGALLLPTATLGSLIRLMLRLCGREQWVQFGPPPGAKPAEAVKEKALASKP